MSAFIALQRALPQHLLSRAVGRLASSEAPFIKSPFINLFARAYDVNMAEAEVEDLSAYTSFNHFFTRALKSDARPLPEDPRTIACPADGAVSQRGTIRNGQLLQAKNIGYRFTTLADSAASGAFEGGEFITIYLAPSDYHRVHVPVDGELTRTVAVPGELFSVNQTTESGVEGLFARNERLVMRFDTSAGALLVIMVGALIVASIETVWQGPTSPYREKTVSDHALSFARGAEIGRFLLGSTVILCFERGMSALDDSLQPGTTVRMGQAIGTM